MGEHENEAPVRRVSVKLPAFWANKPEKWFTHIEAQFIIGDITTSKTKAAYVIAALDETTSDLINSISLDGADPYAEIKAALTRACAKTVRERVADLLSIPAMGAERPSRYATRLLQTAADIETKDFLREIFLRGLPSNIRETLINDTSDLAGLGEKADTFFTTSGAAINAVDAASDENDSINAASRKFERNRGERPSRPNNQPPRQNRPPRHDDRSARQGGGDVDRSAGHLDRETPNFSLCKYHRRFGHDANKCQPPCLMAGNANAGART